MYYALWRRPPMCFPAYWHATSSATHRPSHLPILAFTSASSCISAIGAAPPSSVVAVSALSAYLSSPASTVPPTPCQVRFNGAADSRAQHRPTHLLAS